MIDIPQTLRAIAKDKEARAYFKNNKSVYDFLLPMAKRYIFDLPEEAFEQASLYMEKGYEISLEYMGGEDTVVEEKCDENVAKNIFLIDHSKNLKKRVSICFDLSTIGLSISEEIAFKNLKKIIAHAHANNLEVILSMEEYAKVDSILSIYKRVSEEYDNLGITIQAYLFRTFDDIEHLKTCKSSTIRLVKGVYQEPASVSIERSPQLNERYIECIKRFLAQGKKVNIASHDPLLLKQIIRDETLIQQRDRLTFEMLHGVCEETLYELKKSGFQTKIYIACGKEWYVHFLHRLAENPKNIHLAMEDLKSSKKIQRKYL